MIQCIYCLLEKEKVHIRTSITNSARKDSKAVPWEATTGGNINDLLKREEKVNKCLL